MARAENIGKSRWTAQDARDALKILLVLMLVVVGYFMFAPHDMPERERTVVAAKR